MDSALSSQAFVSLATNDFYATGALTLGRSLQLSGTTRRLALVITSGVSEQMRHTLSQVWDELILVEEIDSGDAESLAILCRPELGVTFTKIAVWTLTQYSKCVFLDADTLVLCNVDELFLREELSAAPDVGWPDCFNSGVFVFCPSQETFRSLLALAQQLGSFDGGDQGLLNMYWSNWSKDDIKYHLPFIYNMTANASYGYAPALLRFKDDVKIIHFIGAVKPWQNTYLRELDTVVLMPGTYSAQSSNRDFILKWWRVYSSLFPLDCGEQTSSSTSQGPHHLTPGSQHSPHLHYQPPLAFPPPPPPSTFSLAYQDGHPLAHCSYRSPVASVGHSSSAHARSSHGDDAILTPMYTVSSSNNSVLNGYRHSITPLDSVSQVGGHSHGSSYGPGSVQQCMHSIASSPTEQPGSPSATSSPYPVSVLSHEDVHSHISLSFYATSIFDQISSLVDTEPRTYYIDDLRSEEEDEDEEKTGTKQYSDTLASSSHVSLPNFITPSSSAIFKHLPKQMDFTSYGHRYSEPPSTNLYRSTSSSSSTNSLPLLPYTEYDVTNEMPGPCENVDSPTNLLSTPAFGGSWEGVGGEKAWSDSVQPYNCPSLSPPLSPSHSSPSSPSISSLPNHVPKDLEVSTHTDIMEARHRQSQAEGAKFSHRREFELGNIDYHGIDSFENIMALIKMHAGDPLETTASSSHRSSSTTSSKSRSRSSVKSGGSVASLSNEVEAQMFETTPQAYEQSTKDQLQENIGDGEESAKGMHTSIDASTSYETVQTVDTACQSEKSRLADAEGQTGEGALVKESLTSIGTETYHESVTTVDSASQYEDNEYVSATHQSDTAIQSMGKNTSQKRVTKSTSTLPSGEKKGTTQFVKVSAQGSQVTYKPRKPVAISDRPPFKPAGSSSSRVSPPPNTKTKSPTSEKK